MKKKVPLLLYSLIFTYILFGQPTQFIECGTKVTNEQIAYLKNYSNKRLQLRPTATIKSIPIKAHIVRTSNGTGGLTTIELNNAIATMNAYYINANIKFLLCGAINYIDNDDYYNMDAAYEDAITSANNAINMINIYFFNSLRTEDGPVCGYTNLPPGPDRIMMVNSCAINGSTLSHEMGHYFSLYHTHGKSNNGTTDELVDGSNCEIAGDDLCDTPADPNLDGMVNESCIYTGTSLDANNQLYAPQTRNIMSYSRKECRDLFTADQYERIAVSLQIDRSYLPCNNCTDLDVIPSPVAACLPIAIHDPDNLADIGPRNITLADLHVATKGYTGDNNQYYIDHTINCLRSVAHLNTSSTYTITVTTGPHYENVRGWIDFNNDAVFQSSELVISSNGTLSFQTHSASFTVPTNGIATCTSLRMRIMSDFAEGNPPPEPCSYLKWGQAEDLIVIIQDQTSPEPSVNIEANTGNLICAGTNVTFTATPVNGGNNPAYQWKLNGNNVGDNSNTYSNNTLANGDVISCVMTSSAQNNCTPTATSNSISMSVNRIVIPTITINASQTIICTGATVVFTATETNGAYASIQWKINGVNVTGNGYLTYTSSTLADGDVVTCVMTSADPCANPKTVTSNSVAMSVSSAVIPSISISASETIICAGSNVTFIAQTVEGNEPDIQWKLNGNIVNRNSSSRYVYNTSTLADGDVVSCEMVSGHPCANPKTVTSNSITMSVSSAVKPSVSISASENNICTGTKVTFIAYPVEGNEPDIQWKLNGNIVNRNSSSRYVYNTSTLADGDVVSCEMVSGHPCANPKTVTSNSITMSVSSAVKPSVSISASENNICTGTNVTFIAYPVEGNEPDIQWKLNGNIVNRNSSSRYVYNTSTLADGDVVSCEMTSGHPCANPKTVISNSIVMNVKASVTPSITISASQNNICTGTSVTFTATAVNGGISPKYQWKIGNTILGSNPTYTTTSLKNGDIVTCTLTSNSGCANNTPVTSEGITMSVSSPPIASIVAGGPTILCSGKSVLLRTSTGTGYTYQWKKSGVNIPRATSSSHMADATGVYTVVVTNSAGCSTTSDGMNITVNPVPLATVVASGPLTFCSSKSVTLRTSAVAGYTYQWKRGAANIDGATQSSYIAIASGLYTVVVTNMSGCSTTSAASNVVVNALPLASITPIGSLTFCAGKNVLLKANTGTNYTYQWKRGGVNIPGETSLYYTAITTGLYNVVVTNAAGCAVTSLPVTVVVNPLPVAVITPGGATTFCNGKNVLLRANTGTNYTYQWKKSGVIIPGETASTYTASATGVYTVVVSNAAGCPVTSPPVSVTVNSLPLATVAPASATTFCAGKDVLLKAITGAGYSYQWKKNGANLTGETNSTYKATATGAYTVVVTNASGCSATSIPINVTVNAAPLATVAIGGPTTFCAGKNVLLKAIVGTGYTYQWRRSGVNIHNATSSNYYADVTGVYTVVVTNAGGCSSTSSGINVTVNAAPPATITYDGPLTFPQGGSVLLKAPAGTGYTYQWKRDGTNINNATGENYMATLSGSYTVVVTNSNTCQATSQTVQVTVTSGRLITKSLNDEDGLIKVYPNPLYRSEYLNIEWSQVNVDNGLVVTVFDITGRLIETKQLNTYDRRIRIKGTSGVYIVEVRWGVNQRKVFRVIKVE